MNRFGIGCDGGSWFGIGGGGRRFRRGGGRVGSLSSWRNRRWNVRDQSVRRSSGEFRRRERGADIAGGPRSRRRFDRQRRKMQRMNPLSPHLRQIRSLIRRCQGSRRRSTNGVVSHRRIPASSHGGRGRGSESGRRIGGANGSGMCRFRTRRCHRGRNKMARGGRGGPLLERLPHCFFQMSGVVGWLLSFVLLLV